MKEINRRINELEVLTSLISRTLQEVKAQQDEGLDQAESIQVEAIPQQTTPIESSQTERQTVNLNKQDNKLGSVVIIPSSHQYTPEEQKIISLNSVFFAAQAASQFFRSVPEGERVPFLEEIISQLKHPGDEILREDILNVVEFTELLQAAMNKVFNVPKELVN